VAAARGQTFRRANDTSGVAVWLEPEGTGIVWRDTEAAEEVGSGVVNAKP
jgi:hypothetical protein